jgi:hypothetical protein
MVLTESQLRKVINEELKQYLIEEGFLSNIKDTAKSVYQKFTGGDKQAQTTAAPASSKATNVPAVNPQIAKQIRDKNIIDKQKTNEYGFLIQNANDINNAWKYYNTLKANNQANIALKQIFNNLRANIQHRKDRAQPLTNREIEIYQRFIKFIEDGIKGQLSQNNISEAEEIKTIIPVNVFSSYIIGLRKIIEPLIRDKSLKTHMDSSATASFNSLIRALKDHILQK